MSDSRFPTSEVLRRLGISDPRHYAIGDSPLQGTIQVLDLSQSVATEPFEARAIFGDVLTGPADGSHRMVTLEAKTAGGSVVEFVTVSAITRIYISNDPDPFSFGGNSNFYVQLGGPPAINVVRAGNVAAGPGTNVLGALSTFLAATNTPIGSRWLVPAGFTMQLATASPNTALNLTLQWRELN